MGGSGAGMPASIEYVVVLLMVGVGKISLKNAFLAGCRPKSFEFSTGQLPFSLF